MRKDGRPNAVLRPVKITRGFTQTPAGSILWQQGNTIVWCTASISEELPPWFNDDRAGGWVTADYVMMPASTPQRKDWPRIGHTDSRGTEIQRLIGRALRGVVDLTKIGPHTIALDCQVLQADGGTRTAAVCGAYLALVEALGKLPPHMPAHEDSNAGRPWSVAGRGNVAPAAVAARHDPRLYNPSAALVDHLAAVSVGVVDDEVRLDLDYADDSRASVDMNVAYTANGRFVEVQGSAEKCEGFDRARMNAMIDMAVAGCEQLMTIQRQALAHS